MLHDLLVDYLRDLEASVRSMAGTHVERYEEEILGDTRVNVRIRVRFGSGHLLELNEAVRVEGDQVQHLGYRYHLQDGQNHLVFRYDNTPHFPDMESFPDHKHLPNRVVASHPPSIPQVVQETEPFAQ